MKILKPGKVEMRKYTCPRCGCEFAATCTEIEAGNYVRCPQDGCRYGGIEWGDGDPYEEPPHAQSDRERLDRLLIPWTDSDSLRGYCVEHLINSGVSFKEK